MVERTRNAVKFFEGRKKKMKGKMVCLVALIIVCMFIQPAHALYEETGKCLDNNCLGAQAERVAAMLKDLKRQGGINGLGYIIHADCKRAFVWKSGVLDRRAQAGFIQAGFRKDTAGCSDIIMAIFDSDMNVVP